MLFTICNLLHQPSREENNKEAQDNNAIVNASPPVTRARSLSSEFLQLKVRLMQVLDSSASQDQAFNFLCLFWLPRL